MLIVFGQKMYYTMYSCMSNTHKYFGVLGKILQYDWLAIISKLAIFTKGKEIDFFGKVCTILLGIITHIFFAYYSFLSLKYIKIVKVQYSLVQKS